MPSIFFVVSLCRFVMLISNKPTELTVKRPWLGLAGRLLLVFSASLTSVFVSTGGWYAELNKPPWNPPGWIFGPVWTLLYILMAVAAWRVWLKGGWSG